MRRRAFGFFFIALALVILGESVWILAKAQLAQLLLARAWEQRVSGTTQPKPWPWADTWPVALLRAPRLGEEHVVLAGASGRNMAFGPTHVDGSAPMGASSNAVLSGHRDTHFAFLERLEPGDEILIDTPDANRHRYRVETTHIVDESDLWVLETTDEKMLTLVTCFPFDAVIPGGPERYVVRAVATD
jgi:sortase A